MKTSKGLIFDIKRFALHDGSGLRTTVFLKGCNLRCQWCHNVEGIDFKPKYFIKASCIHCGHCQDFEPITYTKEKTTIETIDGIDYEAIMKRCPIKAIQSDCKEYSVDELVTELLKDEVFFKYGGVTFSGGEPLMQPQFIEACCIELKKRGIHLALETALNIPQKSLEKMVVYFDEIFCDLKIFDDFNHQIATKVSNQQILKNITYLLKSEYASKVTIRTPLIPNFSASKENITNIAAFLSKLNNQVDYELLNYNPLAISKYQQYDIPYCFEENKPMYSEKEMNEFRQFAHNQGLNNIK